jgi:uncharacterized protein (TIGR02284 family)
MAERTQLNVLDRLVETSRDGEHGYRWAALHAASPEMQDLFTSLAVERGHFVDDLLPHVRRLGGQGQTSGTTAGAIHRGWMTLRDTVLGHDDEALLAEAERGERAAMHAYREALNGMLPPTAFDLIERQYARICAAHERIAEAEQRPVRSVRRKAS